MFILPFTFVFGETNNPVYGTWFFGQRTFTQTENFGPQQQRNYPHISEFWLLLLLFSMLFANHGNLFAARHLAIGVIEQEWSMLREKFAVKNVLGETVFRYCG